MWTVFGSSEGFACTLAANNLCDEENEKAEFMKEFGRTVLETVDPSMLILDAWKLLVVGCAQASMNMKMGVNIKDLSSMTLNSLVCNEGDCVLHELQTHRFAANMKRELPAMVDIVDKLMLDKDFESYLPALDGVKDDLNSLAMALEPVGK